MPIKSDPHPSEFPLGLRSTSLPGTPALLTLSQFTHHTFILQPLYDTLQSNDDEIRSLTLQTEHLVSQSLKKDAELETAREELRMTRIELGSVRETSREERKGIAELKKEVREREGDFVNKVRSGENIAADLRKRIGELEEQQRVLEGDNAGLRDKISGLGEEREGLVMEVEGLRGRVLALDGEMGGLRDVKQVLGTRDVELELLKQERDADRVDKVNLIKEKDEAREGKSSLLKRIDTLVDENVRIQGDVEKHETTIAALRERLRTEVKDHDLYVLRIKTERDDWHDKAEKLKTENAKLERENTERKRKIEEGIALFRSKLDDIEEAPAKRLKTTSSVKEDRIVPESPPAIAGASPDTPRSLSASSPSDARHERVLGNEDLRVSFRLASPTRVRHGRSGARKSMR